MPHPNRISTVSGVSTTVGEISAASGTASASGAPAVSLSHVSKTFHLPHERYHTLKERMLRLFKPTGYELLRAVSDVSLEVMQGEFFGIVGRNGSGKSTLLKCLAGIYEVDEGELAIRGRLSPFIELGVGFNPDLTARDNVVINAVMLGLSRKEALARFDDIVAFAELDDFMDLKLKNYSSGMHVRLAFAVAIQVEAEILLIDEVLAVGDAAFQQKCYAEFARLKSEGRTILFVTHDMGAVERFCDRAMLLDAGRMVDIGGPADISRRYNELNFRRPGIHDARSPSAVRPPSDRPPAEITGISFHAADGELMVTAEHGQPCEIRLEVTFNERVSAPTFAVALQNEAGHTAFAASTESAELETGDWEPGETAAVSLRLENWLRPGQYRIIASVARGETPPEPLDVQSDRSIIVLADRPVGGLVDLPHRFGVRRT